MPPIDPSQIQQPSVRPQPFPGAQPLPSFPAAADPMKIQTQANQNVRTGLDVNQDARAAEALRLQQEAAARQAAEFGAKMAARKSTGGVDTTASEDQAAGHAIMISTNLKALDELSKRDPHALVPTWTEKAVKGLTNNDPDLVAWTQSGKRQVADTAYKSIIDSAVWLMTGAAAPEDQVKRIAATVTPTIFDAGKPEVLAYKRQLLETYLEQAKARAGPANAKVVQALDELQQKLPALYGNASTSAMDQTSPTEYKLSNTKTSIPIPPEMQSEAQTWMAQHPPGKLNVSDYVGMRKALDEKYGFGTGNYEDAQKFVDAYNQGHGHVGIPNVERDLGTLGKISAGAAADPGVVGDIYTGAMNAANAGAAGFPELLAGREGRFAKSLADEAHPSSATAGDVLGSIAPGIGMEALAGKTGLGIVGREMLGNAAYSGLRGANEAEPGDRLTSGALGAAIGGGGSVVSRGITRGARGFLSDETQAAMDDILQPQTFDIPGQRGALPVDDITPARMQTMTDAELANERRLAEQGITAHETLAAKSAANASERQAIEAEAQSVAAANARKQEQFVRENFRSTNPEGLDAIKAEAARQFPTDPAEVLQSPGFASRMGKLREPDATGLPDKSVLEQRIARIDEHMAKSPEGTTGTIPGTDMTTMQRAGLPGVEEAGQGLPGVSGAREKVMESWNKQNSARVLARIGEELPKDVRAGQETNAYVNSRLSAVFNKLQPQIKGKTDAGYNSAIAALREQAVKAGPEQKALWDKIEVQLQKFRNPDGTFNGQGYKEASTGLRELTDFWTTAKATGASIEAGDMARIAEQVRRQTQALVARSNPAIGKQLKAVEGAWAHQARIEQASRGAAKATRGVYSPDQYLSSIERADMSKGKTAVSRGKAFDQKYAQNAREALGGTPAKKASLRETAIGAAGIGLGGGTATAIATAAGLGYFPYSKRLVQALMENKGDLAARGVRKVLGQDSKLAKAVENPKVSDALQRLVTQYIRAKTQ